MEHLLSDLKFAARRLGREKGFVLTVALTLGLCIGANTTIFTLVDATILRPLPFPEPERLVTMWNAYPGAGVTADVRGRNGVPDYFDRRALTDVFEELAVYRDRGRTLEIEGMPQRVRGEEATSSLFTLLRTRAALGRTFDEEEEQPGKDRVVVLSGALWQQLYGGDPSAVGRDLRIDGQPYTVIGVLPEDFVFLDREIRLWTPAVFTPEQRQQYHNNNWKMMARLRPGVSLERAQERIDALNAANLDKVPDLKPLLIDAGFHTPLFFLQDDLVRDLAGRLYLLWGGVGLVLLIGCVNVANLLLVRSTARARELATRFALGASRTRVVRQVVTEVAVLTLVGGALGLLLGWGGLRAVEALGFATLPSGAKLAVDATTVVFTLGLALGVAALVSLLPVAALSRVRLTSVFREEGRGGTASRGVGLLRRVMVAGQVALALVLLVSAGLLMASFQKLLAVDPGFDAAGVLTGSVVLTESRYSGDDEIRSFTERALARVRALPGVERAGLTDSIPFGSGFSDSVIFAEGYVMAPGESVISPTQSYVSPGYFETLGIRVKEGRDFDERDRADGRKVIIIDERLAERFWPNGDALGKRMWMPDSAEDALRPESAPHFDIVGIVESIRMRDLTSQRDALGAYYFPLSQSPRRGLDVALRVSGDPNALVEPVRRALSEVDPELAFYDVRTMEERLAHSLSDRRVPMLLTGAFSVLALLLAALGIYGMLSYLVQLRTREIGIRVALGSDGRAIFGLVLRDGLLVLGAGLVAGLLGALGLSRLVESQLYGVSSLDPGVLLLVLAVLGAAALVACLVPARRATRVDPVNALTE